MSKIAEARKITRVRKNNHFYSISQKLTTNAKQKVVYFVFIGTIFGCSWLLSMISVLDCVLVKKIFHYFVS